MNNFVIHCCSIPDVMVKVRQPHPPQMCWRIHLVNTKHPEDGHGKAQMKDTITRLIISWLGGGMGMYQNQQGLPRQFYKVEERADKRSVGRITSEWTGLKFCDA